jgi:hypothetical protein
MKQRPFFILMLLLIIPLHACGTASAVFGGVPGPVGTAVAQTQTATVWTPTLSPTPVPNESKIVGWLNDELLSSEHALQQTLDARYQVVDIRFPISSSNVAAIMRVDIRCECATQGGCCTPERTFVMVMEAMQKRHEKILEQVPATVSELRVVAYDHTNYLNTMAASWSDVKNYLNGDLNGAQLGARVVRSTPP